MFFMHLFLGQAIHFLKYFNGLYVKNYGAAILDDILIENDPITSPWKLTRRDVSEWI